MATIDSESTEVSAAENEAAPWSRRVLWLIAIWFGSVLALGVVASLFRFMMHLAGMTNH